jgi:putative inorganic carbon (hco3(-)) transporter
VSTILTSYRHALSRWLTRFSWRSVPAAIGLMVGAVIVGLLCVLIGDAAVDRPALYVVLPVVLVTGFLFLYSPSVLLAVILLLRAGTNPVFEETRLPAIGGLGGLLNLVVIVIAAIIISRDPKRVPREAWWVFLPFVLIQSVALTYSPDPLAAVRLFLGYLSMVALFLSGFVLVTNEQELDKSLKLIAWSSLPVVLVTLAYIALGKTAGHVDSLENAGQRFGGPFPHANILAFYLVLAVGVIFYLWKSRRLATGFLTSTAVVAYLLLLVGLLIATKTRSAWIAVLFLCVVYGALKERRYLLYLVVGGALAMLVPEVQERVMGLFKGNEVVQYAKLNSFAFRRLLWTEGLTWMSPSRYFLGYGSEAFFFHSPVFFSMSGGRGWDAHSVVVQLFFETGIVGLSAFGWAYAATARMMLRLGRSQYLLKLVFVSLLVSNFMITLSDNMLAYLIYNWYFWFAIGGVCALGWRTESESARPASVWTK